MSLSVGTHLGPYEILAPLGAGGMGEVYLARDTKLGRQVAIKVVPAEVAHDAERMARFQREAQVLAALNHPHIGTIYGLEEAGGTKAIILELVEGPTIADRIAQGPIPMDEALLIARQIAEALEAAHEKGIIHRDLKPANVKLTRDDQVKVLDFGLAKALSGDASSPSVVDSPTVTAQHTSPGVVLGTAAYMSPEQARGKPVDKRTDIWSFGVVLYECLGGRRPFDGETTSDLIARILEREPDWSTLPPNTPPVIQMLLRRCLAKDRNRRLRDIGDARVDIEATILDPTSGGLWLAGAARLTGSTGRVRRAAPIAVLVALAAVLGAAIGWWLRESPRSGAAPAVTRFSVDVPSPYALSFGEDYGTLSLDPAGGTLAFTAGTQGTHRIFFRKLSAGEAVPVPGTEGGKAPFFSPDGRWLGFFAGGKLMKVPMAGGPPLTICDADSEDAAWLEDGTIVFGEESGQRLIRVSEGGGTPKALAQAGPTQRAIDGEQLLLGFQTVHAIPGAPYVLAGVWDGVTIQDYSVVSVSLVDGSVRPVMHNAVDPQYVAPGYLVFLRESCLLAAPFDVRRGIATGDAVRVIDGVVASKWADQALFATSVNGTLAYVSGGRRGPGRRLIRVDAGGKSEPLMEGTDAITGGLRVSPDGRELSVTTLRRNIELWTFNLDRRAFTMVNNVGESWGPVWTPDGKELVFQLLIPEKEPQIVRKRADGMGPAESVPVEKLGDAMPNSFSPDGTFLLLNNNRDDVVRYRWGQPGPAELVLEGEDDPRAMYAPDGKYFAYTSDETGRNEVVVRTIGDSERKWQISHAGGHEPVWSRDGKKLFFLDLKAVMHAVTIDTNAGFQYSSPDRLFDTNGIATTDSWGIYDVLPDGGFVMVEPAEWEKQPLRINMVVNWAAELSRK